VPFYSSGPGYSGMLKVMVFVDGGYLERNMQGILGKSYLDYSAFANRLTSHLPGSSAAYYLIRIYYYDAIYADKLPEEQRIKHQQIHNTDRFELRLGRLKNDGEGKPKQKGVDALIAIDMVSMAYENHYDIAVLLAGDDDFLDVVKAVKNAGKMVVGFFFEQHISVDLKNILDTRVPIDSTFATQLKPQ